MSFHKVHFFLSVHVQVYQFCVLDMSTGLFWINVKQFCWKQMAWQDYCNYKLTTIRYSKSDCNMFLFVSAGTAIKQISAFNFNAIWFTVIPNQQLIFIHFPTLDLNKSGQCLFERPTYPLPGTAQLHKFPRETPAILQHDESTCVISKIDIM